MNKGLTIMHFFIFLLAVLLVLSGFTFAHLFRQFVNIKKGISETLIINSISDMDNLRNNLQQALRYSYYQASFEIAGDGGTWRYYGDLTFPDMKQKLIDRTLVILNSYASALAGDGITTVDYTHLDVDAGKIPDKEYLSALSKDAAGNNQKLSLAKNLKSLLGMKFELTNDANVFSSIPTKTLTLFDSGKRDFVDKDSIGLAIQKAEGGLSAECYSTEFVYCGFPSAQLCDSYYPAACESQFQSGISPEILKLQNTNDAIKTELDIKEVKVAHESTITATQTDLCSPSVPKYNVRCEFHNYGSAKVQVKISDTTNLYPVYDSAAGKVLMKNIQLNLGVISGNDYDHKLIN